jgi:hypothetical protein
MFNQMQEALQKALPHSMGGAEKEREFHRCGLLMTLGQPDGVCVGFEAIERSTARMPFHVRSRDIANYRNRNKHTVALTRA